MAAMLMPIQQHKFMVVPKCREDFADLFTESVVSADIDLVKKVVRVIVRQSVLEAQLAAVTHVLAMHWIPDIFVDTGGGFDRGKLIEFHNSNKPDAVRHRMAFNYATSDAVVHEIEWDFSAMTMSNTGEAYERAPYQAAPAKAPPPTTFVTPAEAIAELDKDKPKP